MKKSIRSSRPKLIPLYKLHDSTEKFLIHLSDENVIECVLLREGRKTTACVSTGRLCNGLLVLVQVVYLVLKEILLRVK